MHMQLTIFTPTYNREAYLYKLYDSLVLQTNQDFQWIIVDDGSSDSTKEVVKEFMELNDLQIIYEYQKNMGKHIAHNRGVSLCDTELFFCVDSDDTIFPEAVELIINTWNEEKNKEQYSGIVALKGYENKVLNGNYLPQKVGAATLSDLYNCYSKKGETALIYRTELLKKHLFPIFEGEKFLSEEIIYNEIDREGKLIILNKVIYQMAYLENGLTKNYVRAWKSSPLGVMCLLQSRYDKAQLLKGWRKYYRTLRVMVVFNSYCFSKKRSVLKNSPNKAMSIILCLPCWFISLIKFKAN